MLQSLHIKNLALIDETEVFFGRGMNILSGETGAGKSILIGSISLALGGKADKELIRAGAEYALVELVFTLEDEEQLTKIREMEIPVEDGQIILQRRILPTRNTSRVCGETVTARQLRQLAEILIDIHGQHEHQSLLKQAKQAEILDAYGGKKVRELLEEMGNVYRQYYQTKEELEESEVDEETRKRETALAEFEWQEIEAAELTVQEDEELEKRYQKLANSQKIREALGVAHGLCGYEEGGAGSSIGRALREMKNVAGYDETLSGYVQQLTDIDSLLNDCNRGLAEYLSDLDFDEGMFDQTEKRLDHINHLKSKYGDSIEKILAYQKRAGELLDKYRDYDAYCGQLADRVREYHEKALQIAEKLSKLRKNCAEELSEKLQAALLDLNFQNVEFQICVEQEEENLSAKGYDKISFLISTNVGESLKELSQVASGGELSRIMLALKTVLADKDKTETLIFDEIDTGISGKTAWKVSEKMGILSKNHQLICITHLPQIAAMADQHFCIEKQVIDSRSTTTIRLLEEQESVEELARMLGGEQITENAVNNAIEMKELARKSK